MIALWVTYCLAAAAASGIFVVAGWRSKRGIGSASGSTWNDRLTTSSWSGTEADSAHERSYGDVTASLGVALNRVAPLMASQAVRAEVAVPPGLQVRMRGEPLADLLEEFLAASIHGAPASTLLIAAAARGERIYLSITDDVPAADPVLRVARVRRLTERVAMRGGALDVDVRPAEGTIMTLRLAAVIEPRPQPTVRATTTAETVNSTQDA